MNKLLKNCFVFEFELINPGSTKINTNIKKIDGITCSNPII